MVLSVVSAPNIPENSSHFPQTSLQHAGLPPDPYNPLLYGQHVDNRVGLVKELSPRVALITAITELRGEIRDPETNRLIKQVNPLMNELGISVFFHAVTAAANDINTFSNYRTDDKLIYKLMMKWVSDIVYEFYYNRKKYAVIEESLCALIINKAVGLMLPSFFKALGAGDRRAATSSVTEMIQRSMREGGDSMSSSPQSRRRGILSRMNPFSQ